jgi:riboflavin synthase
MFTGIIEASGVVRSILKDRSNIHFVIESTISDQLKIDQSVSHNGTCLTVTALSAAENGGLPAHTVTAVDETLRRTNLGAWREGSVVNLERCLQLGDRLDGHIVQGHVDAVAVCTEVSETGGSWRFTFRIGPGSEHLLVDKGSVCLNGVSLTVVNPHDDLFSVAIIPFTWEHTNFNTIRPGDQVNIEFDIIGKYVAKLDAQRRTSDVGR